ncbi:MAG: serine hydrolase [Bdellovibrionales bacterium]|nr:serine hydrolase [Bdellovibrionales bacterium]
MRVLYSFLFIILFSPQIHAALPTNPETDPQFTTLPNGKKLSDYKVNGTSLFLAKGSGNAFSNQNRAEFENLYSLSKSTATDFQWVLMDLDTHQIIDQSQQPQTKFFGASVSKIFVSGTLLDYQNGQISHSQLQLMANMLVVSSNSAWTELQRQIGGGNADLGRQRIHEFTQDMGYERTRAFQGWWGDLHGNELTALELAEYLYDTYMGQYPGAEYNWKFMHTCRTGSQRAKKYLPSSLIIGGKTGTYHGSTVNPETGDNKFPDGTPYTVKMNSQVIVFHANGHQYALTILANTGTDTTAALLAGGLYRRYIADIP